MKRSAFFLSVFLYAIFLSLSAECQDVSQIKKLSSPIEFDGKPVESSWNELNHFSLTQHSPNYNVEPTEEGDLIIGYDNEYVWIAARMYMKNPAQIHANSKKRDEPAIVNMDHIAVQLDTYNDNENALIFITNPNAARIDYAISNDASMGGGSIPFNYNWNTFWDVKTSRDDKGWYAEIRIPFSSLKFKPENNITTMGLSIRRVISASNEMDTWPAIDPKYGTTANTMPSLMGTISFEGVQPSKPVYVSPYVIGGNSRTWALNTERTEYVRDDEPEVNAGLDVKYNINSSLTLDLTANTDFAQVEADDQQVNLTRYSLYFPEKRMFFQERSSLFDFSLGGRSNLFYSRNIGLSQGETVRIYGGARLTGRMGKWDLGLLDMQTEEHGETPGENFGVIRTRRQVINPYSFVGGIFTSRLGMDGSHNFAYGLDGIFRVFGNDYFGVKIAQTYDDKIGNRFNSIDPMFFSANWERRTQKGLIYQLGYSYSGEEFNPGIGFVNKGSLQGFTGNLSYGWMPGRESKIYLITAGVDASRTTRLLDGNLESLSVSPSLSVEAKSGYIASLSATYQEEGVLFDFPISSGMIIAAGNYSFTDASLRISSPTSKKIHASLSTTMGEFYDGTRYNFSFSPTFNMIPGLQVSGSYQFNHIEFSQRDEKVDLHIGSGKVIYMISTKLTASLLVQYNSTSSNLVSNFRFRFNPREGNDFYLVFNSNRSLEKEPVIPELPDYFNRTILLKYTHTFIF
ncbi:MAG: carbohydrate binding family 9 domain-containing protein [Bacteroidales bacterium]|nr:carbohydrate binding family 9 domain-containing protein [Bacteroidales bacterium]